MQLYTKSSLFLCAIITIASRAMEPMQIEQISNSDRCYLAELPFDLLSLLSEYIIESDEEFVERAKLKKRLNHLPHKYSAMCPSQIHDYGTGMSNGCCHGLMFAVLEYGHTADRTPVGDAQLIIINTQKNVVCYTGCLEKQKYQGVAISQDGNLFATIYERLNDKVTETVLTIQDIITKEKQCAIISNDLNNSHLHDVHIDLNVQATKVVLCEEFYPKGRVQSSVIKREKIIPILIKTTSNSITPLGMYFARNIICKSLPRQLEWEKKI
jgi:hypothetical protein